MKDFSKRLEKLPRNRHVETVEECKKLIKDMWDAGYSASAISREMGRDNTTTLYHLWSLGINPWDRIETKVITRHKNLIGLAIQRSKEKDLSFNKYKKEAAELLNIKKRAEERLKEQRETAFRLYKEGMTYRNIALTLGVGVHKTQSLLKYVPEYFVLKKKMNRYRGSIRPVKQITKDGKLIKNWASISEAAKHIGVSRGAITDVCRGRIPSIGGFLWEYVKK